MQRQALRLRLDAYHSNVSSDWMLIITISCCWLMEWPLHYQHGMPSQGEAAVTGLSLILFHTYRILLLTCEPKPVLLELQGFVAVSYYGWDCYNYRFDDWLMTFMNWWSTVYKDRQWVSTTSHCAKMKPKYPKYGYCHLRLLVWSQSPYKKRLRLEPRYQGRVHTFVDLIAIKA